MRQELGRICRGAFAQCAMPRGEEILLEDKMSFCVLAVGGGGGARWAGGLQAAGKRAGCAALSISGSGDVSMTPVNVLWRSGHGPSGHAIIIRRYKVHANKLEAILRMLVDVCESHPRLSICAYCVVQRPTVAGVHWARSAAGASLHAGDHLRRLSEQKPWLGARARN